MTTDLDRAAGMHFHDYNPLYIIQAVNSLQPLGKDNALKSIRSYFVSRNDDNHTLGLFWVLRVLFNLPAGQSFPEVRIGQPGIPPPVNLEILPRFPIVITRDIPFLAVEGYSLRGLPETVEPHIVYFQKYGIIRSEPLKQPATMEGIENEFLQTWKAAYGDRYLDKVLKTVQAQVFRVIHE